jgi:hypothetical protein
MTTEADDGRPMPEGPPTDTEEADVLAFAY